MLMYWMLLQALLLVTPPGDDILALVKKKLGIKGCAAKTSCNT